MRIQPLYRVKKLHCREKSCAELKKKVKGRWWGEKHSESLFLLSEKKHGWKKVAGEKRAKRTPSQSFL